ncbi:DUF4783 domain-containing protein [Putridiphycobacter roseus]|nr:DUF4783 domain-containing protein [Putridiphycobacter roseus]
MKNLIVLFFLLASISSFAQNINEELVLAKIESTPKTVTMEPKEMSPEIILSVKSDILSGFSNGNAKLLSNYFPSNLDVTITGKSNLYSKSQAVQVLSTFFSQNRVSSFSIIHEGQSNGTKYFIGTYVSASKKFRVTVNVKSSGGSEQITSITIEA